MTVQAARFAQFVIALALMLAAAAIPGFARAQDGHYVTYWTSEQVLAVKRDSSNTIPPIKAEDYPATFPDHYGWDYWTVATMDNRTAEIEGQLIIMSLAVPRDVAPGERHFSARLRYATSADGGATWTDAGWVFEGGPPAIGAWQWSGFPLYDAERRKLHVFYSAIEAHYAGAAAAPQVIAHAVADVRVEGGKLRFDNWSRHRVVLQPDDTFFYGKYEGKDQADLLMSFRDPWVYIDRPNAKAYMVFSSRMATKLETMNGQIGLAEANLDDLTHWRLLPPILAAPAVSGELEIPQLVRQGDRYLLLIATQRRTFNQQHNAPNGLYGWSSESIRGPWRALNGTGLILANPEEQPLGLYAYKVTPELEVLTYIDTPNTRENSLDGKDEAWMRENWVGTLGPVLRFEADGLTTRFIASHRTLKEAREAR